MPLRLAVNGSRPLMVIVLAGARRFPESSRRRVVLPAPFAPTRRVRELVGSESEMSLRSGCVD